MSVVVWIVITDSILQMSSIPAVTGRINMARRATKNDRLEPAVKISRKCLACNGLFTLSHPNSPKLLCEKCEAVLRDMIMERQNEQQDDRNVL